MEIRVSPVMGTQITLETKEELQLFKDALQYWQSYRQDTSYEHEAILPAEGKKDGLQIEHEMIEEIIQALD